MERSILTDTAARLVKSPKGILAIDESMPTCNKRFEKLGIPTTEEKRRDYRELLVTAPEIENYVSGFILFDETLRQSARDGKKFSEILKDKGIEVGIKVDAGTADLSGHTEEKFTQGLEGLGERLEEYKKLGASFAKWRAVYTIGENIPSQECMKRNAQDLAQYAKICQSHDIVPIVEPEVLIDGAHTIERCYEVTSQNLKVIFEELDAANVFLPGMILKTSMVISGKSSSEKSSTEEVAKMTLQCLKENVPAEIGGIVFLSGGQEDEEAAINLNTMHQGEALLWPLTFSYGRAIQNPALQSWAKNFQNVPLAQSLLTERARVNSLASIGEYKI